LALFWPLFARGDDLPLDLLIDCMGLMTQSSLQQVRAHREREPLDQTVAASQAKGIERHLPGPQGLDIVPGKPFPEIETSLGKDAPLAQMKNVSSALQREGGELKVVVDNPSVPFTGSFSVTDQGKPVIAVPKGETAPALSHEFAHFEDWMRARDHVLHLRYGDIRSSENLRLAGQEAQLLLWIPEGSKLTELHAVEAQLESDLRTSPGSGDGKIQATIDNLIRARFREGRTDEGAVRLQMIERVRLSLYPFEVAASRTDYIFSAIGQDILHSRFAIQGLQATRQFNPGDEAELQSMIDQERSAVRAMLEARVRFRALRQRAMEEYAHALAARVELLRRDVATLSEQYSPQAVEPLFRGLTADLNSNHPLNAFRQPEGFPLPPTSLQLLFSRVLGELFH
jgi:hypothetical protein